MGLMFCRQCHHLWQQGSGWHRTRTILPSSPPSMASSSLSIRTLCRSTPLHIELQAARRYFSYRWPLSALTYQLPERSPCTLDSSVSVAANTNYSRTPKRYVWHNKLDSLQRRYYGMRNRRLDRSGYLQALQQREWYRYPRWLSPSKKGR